MFLLRHFHIVTIDGGYCSNISTLTKPTVYATVCYQYCTVYKGWSRSRVMQSGPALTATASTVTGQSRTVTICPPHSPFALPAGRTCEENQLTAKYPCF
jgi:hypothetical protein